MHRGIKLRIVLSLLIPTLLIGGILLFFILFDNRQLMSRYNDARMADHLEAYATEVNDLIRGAEADSGSIVYYFEHHFISAYLAGSEASREALTADLKDFLLNLSNSHRERTYFINFLPQDPRMPESFGYGDYNQDGYPDPMPLLSRSYYTTDILSEDKRWFFDPLQLGEGGWYGPYVKFKGIEDGLVMTYSLPVKANGKTVAVAGVDLPLLKLGNQISAMTYYETGYAVLQTKNARIITHPTLKPGQTVSQQLGRDYRPMEALMMNNRFGQHTYKWADNRDKVMFFTTLENNWKLVLTAYEDEVYYQNEQMNQSLTLLFLLSILGVLVFSLFFGNWIGQPLVRLSRAIQDPKAPDYNTLRKLSQGSGEVAALSKLLEGRLSESRSQLEELNHYNQNLSHMVAERNEALIQANQALAEQQRLLRHRQEALMAENDALETAIQTAVASQDQQIEREKIWAFTEIISKVTEEIKPPLARAAGQVAALREVSQGLQHRIASGEYSRRAFSEAAETAKKNSRRLLGELIFSKDIIDYIKDLATAKNFKQTALIELGDYLEKAAEKLRGLPAEYPLALSLPPAKLTYLKIDAAKFAHILDSVLLHMVSAAFSVQCYADLRIERELFDSGLTLRVIGNFSGAADLSRSPAEAENREEATAQLGLSMIELLMQEAFNGTLKTEMSAYGFAEVYELHFPDVVV